MDFMIIVIMLMTLYLAFGIGSNDETMSSVVGSGTLSLNRAVLWGGLLACLGCIIFADNVGKNIGASLLSPELLEEYDIWMILAIILSTSTWLIYASRSGAPISTTHSVVGAVIGVAFMWSFIPGNDFLYSLNWLKLGTIALGWVISPIFGLLTAAFMQNMVQKYIHRKWKQDGVIGFLEIEELEKKFKYILLFFISITQLSRGGNDSANAIGIYSGLIVSGDISDPMAFLLKVLIGLTMALGLILVGKNVIKNVGGSLIEMRPSDAFAIESANALVIFTCTMLGLPISGSHVLIFAIVGSGFAKGEKPNWVSLKKMVKAWLLTFPAAAVLSGIFYLLFILIF
ncbi:MAG: inorganic phosphate transporter [Promethearchaeota archaeon]